MPEVLEQRLYWQMDEPVHGGRLVASIDLNFEFERDGNKWVGTCRELSTSTYARSLRKTQEALKVLVVEHLNLLEQSGERNRFFDEWDIVLSIAPTDVDQTPKPLPASRQVHQKFLGIESDLAGAVH